MYDVVIIGAGVIGTFIARELSRYDLKVALLEKENDVADGTTKANTAIIHAGYDATPGTNKARFNAAGNPMFDKVCQELDVEFKRIGSLVIGFDDEDLKKIDHLYDYGIKNGIPNMKILTKEEVRDMEPSLSKEVVGALHAPSCGIIGPWELAIALAENAMDNGVELFLNNEVTDINKAPDGYKVLTNKQEIRARYVINCAGLYADKINNMVATPYFKIMPRRGQYYLLDKSAGDFVNSVIFQCPTKMGKGVIVAPTIHGNLIVGPDAENINDKESTETTDERMAFVKAYAQKTSGDIPLDKVITTFAGIRAEPSTGDFIIEESNEAKGFINVAGTKSPGLSSSPAIADYVVELIKGLAHGLKEKENFNPKRKPVVRFSQLSNEDKAAIIDKDPSYGKIICRCEHVTEGEIVDSIRRHAGARTVDGVKRRARPGSGRCQGGFCGPRVIEILARELDKDMSDIVKDSLNSYILTGPSNKGMEEDEPINLTAASAEE